jgi:hypothetical protein
MKTATKSRTAKTCLVEKSSCKGAYDMYQDRILIDHASLGRILISEGFGGNGVEGETYRFKHGMALRVPADATIASLDKEEEAYGPLSYVYEILDWDGAVIQAIAESHG